MAMQLNDIFGVSRYTGVHLAYYSLPCCFHYFRVPVQVGINSNVPRYFLLQAADHFTATVVQDSAHVTTGARTNCTSRPEFVQVRYNASG